MDETPALTEPRRRGGSQKRQRTRTIRVACTEAEFAAIHAAAGRAGLSAAAFIRHQTLGTPGPRSARRPPIERVELARLLGETGRLGSNVNQLAKAANAAGDLPDATTLAETKAAVLAIRAALLKALGRDH
jgi:hypothetical protein